MKISECVGVLEDRLDSCIHAHGELLAILCLEENRDQIYANDHDAINTMFELVDKALVEHRRMKGLIVL